MASENATQEKVANCTNPELNPCGIHRCYNNGTHVVCECRHGYINISPTHCYKESAIGLSLQGSNEHHDVVLTSDVIAVIVVGIVLSILAVVFIVIVVKKRKQPHTPVDGTDFELTPTKTSSDLSHMPEGDNINSLRKVRAELAMAESEQRPDSRITFPVITHEKKLPEISESGESTYVSDSNTPVSASDLNIMGYLVNIDRLEAIEEVV